MATCKTVKTICWASTLLLFLCGPAASASPSQVSPKQEVTIKATDLGNNIVMLSGRGGNIGVLVGKDGTLMVDDQFEPLAPLIEKAIASIKNAENPKVRYVVNTHYHGDHTGGNKYFAKSASVLAHENVRRRLATKSSEGLPVITYQGGVKLHLNGEDVHVLHLSAGHTDGDSVVYFANANVWHLGDLFFNGLYPYIDTSGGGSVKGYIRNISKLISKIDSEAKIIPGHGPLATKDDLKNLLAMITATKLLVETKKHQGLSLDEVINQGVGEQWASWDWSFITEKKWITTLYEAE